MKRLKQNSSESNNRSGFNGESHLSRRAWLGKVSAATTACTAGSVLGPTRWIFGAVEQSRSKLIESLPNGVEVWQVTTEDYAQSNIYCEVPYCSADSRLFVYARQNPRLTGNRTEFMAVELGTWRQDPLDAGVTISGCAISPDGKFYYLKNVDSRVELWRADVAGSEKTKVYEFPSRPRLTSLGTVSSDHRYYACGVVTDPNWQMFDILLVDLSTGESRIIDRDPHILNPHVQFEPGEGRQLLVQHNRGGKYTPDGKLERLVGEEGATLYLLSVPDGKRTPLLVGKPYTTPCTGHEAWIGNTKEVLLTVAASGEFAREKGNLLGVRAERPARVVARGYSFNHVGVSRCGRLFSADDWQGQFKVIVGSTKTGRCLEVCDSHTSPTRDQATHVHPYLTPDLKWVIFNSNRTGQPHIYAARIPNELIHPLLEETDPR